MKLYDNHCYRRLADQIIRRLHERDEYIAQLLTCSSKEAIEDYIDNNRRILRDSLTFPVSYTVDASVSICSDCSLFHIENVLISVNNAYSIPANVYVPAGEGPFPAVIISVGHWPEGKSMKENRILCANLARNGILAIVYDPIYQGERMPFSKEFLEAVYPDISVDMQMVNLHMQSGNISYLLGRNLGEIFVFDGERIIDYLCSRPDVDASRIGAAGQSGGGTQTTYLAALDERISCYVPIQCITRLEKNLTGDGIGDCEQSIVNINSKTGFDCADILWAAFPKPCMINAASRDFFDFDGAQSVADELKRLYSIFGRADDFSLCVTDGEHWLDSQARQHTYDFFTGQFFGKKAMAEIPADDIVPEKLCCDPGGMRCKSPHILLQDELDYCKKTASSEQNVLHWVESAVCEKSGHPGMTNTVKSEFVDNHSDTLCVLLADPQIPIENFTGFDADILRIETVYAAEAYKKKIPGYDLMTCIFNEAAITGNGCASVCAGQAIREIEKHLKTHAYSQIRLIAQGPAAAGALMAGMLLKKIDKTYLLEASLSFKELFSEKFNYVNELYMETGMLPVADLTDLAEYNNSVIAINPRKFSDEKYSENQIGRIEILYTDNQWEEAFKR